MRSPSILPGHAGWVATLVVALLPVLALAAPGPSPDAPVATVEAAPPVDLPPADLPALETLPPADLPPLETLPPAEVPPPDDADVRAYQGPDAAPAPEPEPKPKPKKKKKKKKAKKKKKPKKPKEVHKVNQGMDYQLGLYPGSYVQGADVSVGAKAGLRQILDPKKNHRIILGLGYEYEPFSTKTLGFPEEDEVQGGLNRTLVQAIHIIEANALRRIVWGKLVTTTLELHGDAWWPMKDQHQRWAVRATSGMRIGLATGFFGEVENQFFYKQFPNYFIADRHINQAGAIPTGRVGYNFAAVARLAAGFTFDYTHYIDARYNTTDQAGSFTAPDGSFLRSTKSKNYLDYIPFAELQVRPTKGLRLRARYAFERQKTQNYNRVMTGRNEFASLTPYLFRGYYDYRRHRASIGVTWDFRDRLRLAGGVEAWVRRFDVYEARDVDNYWTGQLRLDTEIEASLEAAVRVHTIKGKHREHDFLISLLGAHVSRRSNMTHEISLATNFDITRVMLGFEVRGH